MKDIFLKIKKTLLGLFKTLDANDKDSLDKETDSSEKSSLGQLNKILFASLIAIICIYFLGVLYYQHHLFPRTRFASVSVSELNAQAAEQKIKHELGGSAIKILEKNQDFGVISLEKLGLKVNALPALEDTIEKQNAFQWPLKLISPESVQITDKMVTYDDKMLETLLDTIGVDNQERLESQDAFLIESEGGEISIQNEVYGQQISPASLTSAINSNLSHHKESVPLEEAYIKPKITKDSKEIHQTKKNYLDKLQLNIVHVFDGHSIQIPHKLLDQWLQLDEEGNLEIDQEAIREYIFDLNKQYTGRFQYREFNSTYQGLVTVQPGTFGWFIDADQESEALVDIIKKGQDVEREPVIVGQGYGQDPSQAIGNTYVEIDLTYQMMLVYRDGELLLETPIVSGKYGSETIPGAYQVWNMERDAKLKGYNPHLEKDYVQPVSYWIAFDNQAQGIHDANWQSNFGGSVYQQYGSLGCINTPPGVMPQVYELIDYGWPVIVF